MPGRSALQDSHHVAHHPAHVEIGAGGGGRQVREELTARVLDGWDPEEVATRMAALRRDNGILADWARHVQPPDRCRWDLRPEMDYLDTSSC